MLRVDGIDFVVGLLGVEERRNEELRPHVERVLKSYMHTGKV